MREQIINFILIYVFENILIRRHISIKIYYKQIVIVTVRVLLCPSGRCGTALCTVKGLTVVLSEA